MNESVEQSDPLAHSLNTFLGTEQSYAVIQVYMVYIRQTMAVTYANLLIHWMLSKRINRYIYENENSNL